MPHSDDSANSADERVERSSLKYELQKRIREEKKVLKRKSGEHSGASGSDEELTSAKKHKKGRRSESHGRSEKVWLVRLLSSYYLFLKCSKSYGVNGDHF